ncbi:MAG: hypothetical protein JW918_05505 [Anaerolineae bacterium]|nr:hypothetical protein [Anaerolineae bacterium]
MRCRKCNHIYKPTRRSRACPQCGYEPPPDETRRRAPLSERWAGIEDRVARAVLVVCPIIALVALVTGQMLILGGLLAVVLGAYLVLYSAFGRFDNLSNGGLARGLSIGFGLLMLAGGIGSWVWALSGGPVPPFPPRIEIKEVDIYDISPFIPIGIMALASGLGYLVTRWLARLEAHRRKRSAEEGHVFAIPSMARGPMMMVMVLLVPMMLFLVLSALNGANTGVTPSMGFGVPLILSPILIFALYMLRHNSGHVVLTKDAVLLRRLGRERRVRYEEILAVKDFAFALPPDLVLRGRGKRLRVPRSVENFPTLYQIIRQRRDALRPTEAPRFPYRLAVAKRAWVFAVAVLVVAGVFYLGLGLYPAWDALLKGQGLPLAPEVARSTAILFSIMSAVFIPAIVLFIVGSFKLRQPSALVFTKDEIRFRFPFQGWRTREAGELERVYLDPVHRAVTARHEGVAVSVEMTHYALVLRFEDGLELWIDLDRALQFGSSPERLHGALTCLYPGSSPLTLP